MKSYNEIELLQEVKINPTKYLGKPTLDCLHSFICGHDYHAKIEHGKSIFDGFYDYIANIYKINTDHSWYNIITFFNDTEEKAFYKFYNHMDEYLQQCNDTKDFIIYNTNNDYNQDNNLYKILIEIKKRPYLYFGTESLGRLYAFINGYNFYKEDNLLDGFTDYVKNKYKVNTNRNFADIISYFHISKSDAFNDFYILLDEFLKIKSEKCNYDN